MCGTLSEISSRGEGEERFQFPPFHRVYVGVRLRDEALHVAHLPEISAKRTTVMATFAKGSLENALSWTTSRQMSGRNVPLRSVPDTVSDTTGDKFKRHRLAVLWSHGAEGSASHVTTNESM